MTNLYDIPADIRVIILTYSEVIPTPGAIRQLIYITDNLIDHMLILLAPELKRKLTPPGLQKQFDNTVRLNIVKIYLTLFPPEDYYSDIVKAFIDVFNPTPGKSYNPRDDVNVYDVSIDPGYEALEFIFAVRIGGDKCKFRLEISHNNVMMRYIYNMTILDEKNDSYIYLLYIKKNTHQSVLKDFHKFCICYLQGYELTSGYNPGFLGYYDT